MKFTSTQAGQTPAETAVSSSPERSRRDRTGSGLPASVRSAADFEQAATPCTCHGETLLLHPERCVYWPAGRTLLVADIHFGKEHSFGRAGIAIPGGVSEQDLDRLSALLQASGAEHLHILGDFLHAAPDAQESWLSALSAFLDRHAAIRISVVAGNHDRHGGQLRVDSRIVWHHKAQQLGPFVLQHHPGSDARGYVICGHLHPAYRVPAGHHRSLRAPAFWFRETYAVLPAFGSFTGGQAIAPTPADRLFVAGPDCVLPVDTSAARRARRSR